MRSDMIKKGLERTPHRALLKGTGVPQSQMDKPFIGVATSFTDLIPGHVGMRDLERFIEKGVHTGGGHSFFFGIPGVCDGMAMGHKGMHYSLPTRELIADMYTAYYDKPFPTQDIPRLPNQLLSPAEVGQVLFKHFDAMDHLNHEAVMKDFTDTAKSLGRQPAGVTRPTASRCSAASPFSRSPEPPLPVIDPIPIDPIAINSVPINPIAINPSPIDPVPSSPIAINPNPIRGGSGERLKGLAAEQLEAVGRVTPVFNNKIEEKINPIDEKAALFISD